jgi:trypsin
MTRRSLLLSSIAATAAANIPLHLQAEGTPHPPRLSRRRRRVLQSSSSTTTSANNSTSNDLDLSLLQISPLLPQTSSSGPDDLDLAPRIINGAAAPSSRYPYAASLIDSSNRHICGGTLIAPDIILTAGHCSGFFTSVLIDKYDVESESDEEYDYLVVEEHYAHPNYGNIIQSDFSIAKLYGRSDKSIVSINTDSSTPEDDEYLTVMGWGVTVEGVSSTQSNVLREVEVQYMSNTECDSSSGMYDGNYVTYDGYIEGNMMCAWSENKDACQVSFFSLCAVLDMSCCLAFFITLLYNTNLYIVLIDRVTPGDR